MSIKDIRLLDAIIKLHEVARVVEDDLGVGELSKTIKEAADTLSNVARIKEWVK